MPRSLQQLKLVGGLFSCRWQWCADQRRWAKYSIRICTVVSVDIDCAARTQRYFVALWKY